MRPERRGEQRGERRDRPVHQPGEPRLHHLEHEQPTAGGRVALGRLGRQRLGRVGVLALLLGQVAEQLPGADVGRPGRGRLVEPPRLDLHHLGPVTGLLGRQRVVGPDRLAADEPADVVAAHQRDVLAEPLAEHPQQPVPVPVLVGPHPAELVGDLRVLLLERRGQVLVDAGVLLLQRDRQGEDLPLGQAVEAAHGSGSGLGWGVRRVSL